MLTVLGHRVPPLAARSEYLDEPELPPCKDGEEPFYFAAPATFDHDDEGKFCHIQ